MRLITKYTHKAGAASELYSQYKEEINANKLSIGDRRIARNKGPAVRSITLEAGDLILAYWPYPEYCTWSQGEYIEQQMKSLRTSLSNLRRKYGPGKTALKRYRVCYDYSLGSKIKKGYREIKARSPKEAQAKLRRVVRSRIHVINYVKLAK